MARVLFFGRLRDLAPAELSIAATTVSLHDLLTELHATSPALGAALAEPSVRVVLNHVMLPRGADPRLAEDDEIAFLPPFSGG